MIDTRLYITETSGVIGTEVDLYDGVAFNLSYAIADIRNPEKRNTSLSKTITIPGTKANNRLFEHIFEVDLEGGFNPNQKAYAVATADTIEVFTGIVQLLQINIYEDNKIEYEIALKGSTGTLFSLISDKYLHDLDLSLYNHIPSKTKQATSWSAAIGAGYVYPVIDNGLHDLTAIVPILDSEDMAPAIYAKTLVDQIFAENSFTYTSDFLTSDFFKRILVYSNRPFPKVLVTFSGSFKWHASAAPGVETVFTLLIRHYDASKNVLNHITIQAGGYNDGTSPTYTWSWSKAVEVEGIDIVQLEVILESGEITIDTISTFVGTYASNDVIGTADFSVSKALGSQSVTSIGTYDIVTWDTEASDPGNTFSLVAESHAVPVFPIKYTIARNIKQRDFLTSIFQAFNLYVWENNQVRNGLFIEPRDDFYLSGTIYDWTAKLDRSRAVNLIPMGELDFKTMLFKYKEDSDFFNAKYKGDYAMTYGDKILEIDNDFMTNTKTLQLIFANTPMVSYPNTDMVFPSIVKEGLQNADDYFGGEIRLLYYGGLKATTSGWIHRDVNGDTNYATYPYCGHLDDPYASTLDLCFDSPKEVYFIVNPTTYTNNNLYNAYYSVMMEEITDPDSKLFVGYFYLTPDDILKLSFRYLYQVDFHFLRLNKIYEYDPKRRVTKCEFIKVKSAVPFSPGTLTRSQIKPSKDIIINGTVISGVDILDDIIVAADNVVTGEAGIIGANVDVANGYSGSKSQIISGGIAK